MRRSRPGSSGWPVRSWLSEAIVAGSTPKPAARLVSVSPRSTTCLVIPPTMSAKSLERPGTVCPNTPASTIPTTTRRRRMMRSLLMAATHIPAFSMRFLCKMSNGVSKTSIKPAAVGKIFTVPSSRARTLMALGENRSGTRVVHLWDVRANVPSTWRLTEKAVFDKRLEEDAAGIGLELPQALGLMFGEREAGHFEVLASNPVHNYIKRLWVHTLA